MARYHPIVEAIQWTGTNIIEMRQFVRAATGVINDAVIRDGVLYLTVGAGGGPVNFETLMPVQVGQWVVRSSVQISILNDADFVARYAPESAPVPIR